MLFSVSPPHFLPSLDSLAEEMGAKIGPMMDQSAHWDQVLLIVHLGGPTPEK